MFRFDFAISYAGEEKGLAYDLYRLLRERGANVFFSEDYKVYLFGKRLRSELKDIFGPKTKFSVVMVSKNYATKYWPRYEFGVARKEELKRRIEFILPVRIDDVNLEGLAKDVFYMDLRRNGVFSTADAMIRKPRDQYPIEEVGVPKVWVATFGVIIDDLLESDELPSSAPRNYINLCDWLEKDLTERLSKSPVENFKFSEQYRDGEALSVRIAFRWDPVRTPLNFGDIGWWEVLEIQEFEEVYPDQRGEDFLCAGEGYENLL